MQFVWTRSSEPPPLLCHQGWGRTCTHRVSHTHTCVVFIPSLAFKTFYVDLVPTCVCVFLCIFCPMSLLPLRPTSTSILIHYSYSFTYPYVLVTCTLHLHLPFLSLPPSLPPSFPPSLPPSFPPSLPPSLPPLSFVSNRVVNWSSHHQWHWVRARQWILSTS